MKSQGFYLDKNDKLLTDQTLLNNLGIQ